MSLRQFWRSAICGQPGHWNYARGQGCRSPHGGARAFVAEDRGVDALGVEQVRILRGEDRVGVPPGYQLDEISADAVIAALSELMAAYPPSPEERRRRLDEGISDVDHLAVR